MSTPEKRPRGRPRKIKEPEPEPEPEEVTLEGMSRDNLKKIALAFNSVMNIPNVKNLKKDELIDILNEYIEIEDGEYVKLKSDFSAHEGFDEQYEQYQTHVPVKRALPALQKERDKLLLEGVRLKAQLKTTKMERDRYTEIDEPKIWRPLNKQVIALEEELKALSPQYKEIEKKIKELEAKKPKKSKKTSDDDYE